MKLKAKLLPFLILPLIMLGCTSAPAKTSEQPATKETQKEKISIVLDWTPNTNHTGLYVAKDKGYFDEAGVDVEIVPPPEGSTTQLIGSGKGQFGISFQDTLAQNFASDNPMPITSVLAILQHNTSGVVSLKEQNIATPKALTGKRYSTWDDPIELAMLKYIVNQDGGDFEKVTKVPYAENIIAQLQDKSANGSDSGWIYYAWDGIAFKVKGLETNFINFADYGKELDYYTPVLIANNDYLKDNNQQAQKVIDAIVKGYEFAAKNPDESAQILLNNAPELDKELVVESQKWISSKYIDDAEKFGVFDKDRWNNFYAWLWENKLIQKEIPKDFGFTNEYIK